tara:strand:+ start:243 stop:512 length:270 start_codon:yes stop_codon:yes gene_type:complete
MDIVDRLRQRIGLVKFDSDAIALHEAANEIERLQGILRLITELSPFKLNPGHASLKFFAEMPREQEISFCSVRLIEITTLAHEALKEKA